VSTLVVGSWEVLFPPLAPVGSLVQRRKVGKERDFFSSPSLWLGMQAGEIAAATYSLAYAHWENQS
jgi:hypothetical protein